MINLQNFTETKPYRRLSFAVRVIVIMPIIAAALVALLIGLLLVLHSYLPLAAQDDIAVFLARASISMHSLPSLIPVWGIGTLIVWPFIYRSWFGGALGRIILSLQRFFDAGSYSKGGSARFAGMTADAHASNGSQSSSVYLGRSLFARWWRLGWKPEKHFLTLAGSRGGKGAGVIIPNLLQWEGSTLVIDPKGTNTHVTAERRRRMGIQVHALDPYGVTNETSAGFNPLDYIDPASDSVVEDIDVIASSIVPSVKDEKEAHFSDSASALLSGYIAHVLTSPDYPNPSLLDVRDIINMDEDEALPVLSAMYMNDACGGLAHEAAKRMRDGQGRNEHDSVVRTLKRHMKWLSSKAHEKTMRASTFDIDAMKRAPTSIYLILPPDLIGEQATFLRLFLNVALNRYIRGGRATVPGLFLVDETAALGYVKRLPRAYREHASYNLRVWTFWQSKSDIDELYGAEGQAFITNSDAIQCFSLADEDCDWLARMIGTRGMVDDVTRTSAVMEFRDRTSIAKEIAAPSPSDKWFGKMYLLRPGRTPHLAENIPYFRSYSTAFKAFRDPDFPTPSFEYNAGKFFLRALAVFYLILAITIFLPIIVLIFSSIILIPIALISETFFDRYRLYLISGASFFVIYIAAKWFRRVVRSEYVPITEARLFDTTAFEQKRAIKRFISMVRAELYGGDYSSYGPIYHDYHDDLSFHFKRSISSSDYYTWERDVYSIIRVLVELQNPHYPNYKEPGTLFYEKVIQFFEESAESSDERISEETSVAAKYLEKQFQNRFHIGYFIEEDKIRFGIE